MDFSPRSINDIVKPMSVNDIMEYFRPVPLHETGIVNDEFGGERSLHLVEVMDAPDGKSYHLEIHLDAQLGRLEEWMILDVCRWVGMHGYLPTPPNCDIEFTPDFYYRFCDPTFEPKWALKGFQASMSIELCPDGVYDEVDEEMMMNYSPDQKLWMGISCTRFNSDEKEERIVVVPTPFIATTSDVSSAIVQHEDNVIHSFNKTYELWMRAKKGFYDV